MKRYEEMFNQFKKGEISIEEWKDYTKKITFQILEDNKEVFKRLKFQ